MEKLESRNEVMRKGESTKDRLSNQIDMDHRLYQYRALLMLSKTQAIERLRRSKERSGALQKSPPDSLPHRTCTSDSEYSEESK